MLNFKMEEEDMKHFRFRDLLEAVKSKITDCSLEVPDSIAAVLYISCPSNIRNNFSCQYLKWYPMIKARKPEFSRPTTIGRRNRSVMTKFSRKEPST